MGRSEIAGFSTESYESLQLQAIEIANSSNKLSGFEVVQAQLGREMLQQAQECPPRRDPLRQNGRKLSRLDRHHINPTLAPPFVNMT